MLQTYFKTAWRNFAKNKAHSFINIAGLSIGMAVAILIGLWIWDELAFNKNFANYNRIAQVMQHQTFNGETGSQYSLPYLTGEELRKNYGSDFKHVSMATWTNNRILAFGDTKVSKGGNFMEPEITEMLSLKMLAGRRDGLSDPHSVILAASTAEALFGKRDPMNKVIKIDNKFDVKVAGVYEDIPYNSDFKNLAFIAPWQLYIDDAQWTEKYTNPWRNNSFQALVQLADNADVEQVSAKIRDVKLKRVTPADAAFKPEVFLLPMDKWHLYSEFKNGVNVGGRIQYLRLFGVIGFFVLLLACINFMNLSTARSEKRAKEVGIRKTVGSVRGQLIGQFFSESLLMALFALVLSLLFAQLVLPYFNNVADKRIVIPWNKPFCWMAILAFTFLTGIVAGSYPALYLSSFDPITVLKGTFRAGRAASLPRKVLVVVQFAVSLMLVIGAGVVYNQIQFAKARPVGYSREGLLSVPLATEEIHKHFDAVCEDLKQSGAVAGMAEASSGATYVNETDNGFEWRGKDPSLQGDFGVVYVSKEFGKTVNWQLKDGRDFSKDFPTDSSGMIVNEAAVKFMNLQDPVGKIITWDGQPFHVLGVVKDLVMQSPYEPVFRTVFVTNNDPQNVAVIRLNPATNPHDALAKIEAVFKKYNPAQPFEYSFTDEAYSRKFGEEERIGKLTGFFAALAIFISCLGLFALSSFMAEQRKKEIGVRKVLGASVLNVWNLLSRDFLWLVIVAFVIALPLSWYFMHNWLQNYSYRTPLSWWIFTAAGGGIALITLLTVSFQSIKAALANPVKSLRTE